LKERAVGEMFFAFPFRLASAIEGIKAVARKRLD
jgi:hypothetical protein